MDLLSRMFNLQRYSLLVHNKSLHLRMGWQEPSQKQWSQRFTRLFNQWFWKYNCLPETAHNWQRKIDNFQVLRRILLLICNLGGLLNCPLATCINRNQSDHPAWGMSKILNNCLMARSQKKSSWSWSQRKDHIYKGSYPFDREHWLIMHLDMGQ